MLWLYNNIIRGKCIYLEKTKLLTGFLAALNGDLIRYVLLTRPWRNTSYSSKSQNPFRLEAINSRSTVKNDTSLWWVEHFGVKFIPCPCNTVLGGFSTPGRTILPFQHTGTHTWGNQILSSNCLTLETVKKLSVFLLGRVTLAECKPKNRLASIIHIPQFY